MCILVLIKRGGVVEYFASPTQLWFVSTFQSELLIWYNKSYMNLYSGHFGETGS